MTSSMVTRHVDSASRYDANSSAGVLAGLRVCVVACHFRPESSGSAPYNSLLVDTLADAGATVQVITGVPHYPQWRVVDRRYRAGLLWRESPTRAAGAGSVSVVRLRHAVPRNAGLLGRMRLDLSFAALSAPAVAAAPADVVIAVTPLLGAAVAGMVGRRRRPFGAIVHDQVGKAAVQSGTAGGRISELVAAAEYSVLRRADRIGVITERFRPSLIAGGVDDRRIVELPLFSHVNRADLTPEAARHALGWPDTGRLTVVHTGNMGMKQGLEHVLQAARVAAVRYPEQFEFVFVGDGNTRQALEQQAGGLEGVRFIDPVSEAMYPLTLAAADVLLVHERPGVREMSLPSKLTSYTTASRPVIAAVAEDGITGSLLGSCGAALLVPNGDPEALVRGLCEIRSDDELRARLVHGAARLGQAEFSERSGRQHFVNFAKALADTSQQWMEQE
ncbi:glycosyltransferase family 4 protein [Mycolicibacterium sp. 018/SC-01/001]|uniref:glycosyltransferase family 4 protein n=1 Tax=Mycolicibacterium sp. 018/SC-01/001 TaxID=2592069 RepID=UPI00163D58B9|nr:glycosyltransferase family 4 protein [Mycolicibacterium sp. 018/SC-01/001]